MVARNGLGTRLQRKLWFSRNKNFARSHFEGYLCFLFGKQRTHLYAEPSHSLCCMFKGEMFARINIYFRKGQLPSEIRKDKVPHKLELTRYHLHQLKPPWVWCCMCLTEHSGAVTVVHQVWRTKWLLLYIYTHDSHGLSAWSAPGWEKLGVWFTSGASRLCYWHFQ